MSDRKERPIIFSAPMIRAILEGRKTVTRRVVKPQPEFRDVQGLFASWAFKGGLLYPNAKNDVLALCPYGQPGDQLWLREAWRPAAWRDEGRVAVDYRASPEQNRTPWLDVPEGTWAEMWPRLTDEALAALDAGRGSIRSEGDGFRWDRGDSPCRWRPSIHMPRWASRITLEVTSVRVERLQDISEDDAIAEGLHRIEIDSGYRDSYSATPSTWAQVVEQEVAAYNDPTRAYRDLWESINGAGSWDANPWVWVINFKRVEVARG